VVRVRAKMKDLSPPQADVLKAIERLTKERGYCPTVREICDSTGRKSTNAVQEILDRLQRDGRISRAAGLGRTITIKKGGNGGSK